MTRDLDEGKEPETDSSKNSAGRGHFGPRGFRSDRGIGGPVGEAVLAGRFARGEIDADEYRERLAALREAQAKKDEPRDA